jgi:dTDP-4-amino-4,6-dideoxygalactose transaminase
MEMKFEEIGSNFFTDKFFYSELVNENIIKEKYGSKLNIIYPSLGRNAISYILKGLNQKKKVALLPGYTCESVIEPFLHKNYEVLFYSFNKDLSINLIEFENRIEEYKPSLILVHGFYGYNTFLPAKSIIQKARENGCIIIQDDTQTIFSDEDIIDADFYIGSIRKWLEVPDGSYICCDKNLPFDNYSVNETFIELTTAAFKLKTQYSQTLDKKLKIEYKKLFLDAQNLIDNDFSIYEMSNLSKGILNLSNINIIKNSRIKNYKYLFKNINKKFNGIIPVFNSQIESRICPVYFPLYVEKREQFQHLLSENDIYATIIWPKSRYIHSINEETEYIYSNIIGIPCDQRYDLNDMSRVINLIRKNF